jgi:hypothetical protein
MIDDDLCVPHVVCLRVFICFFWGGAQSPRQGVNWDDEVIHVLGLGTPYFLCRDLSIWINYGWTPDEQNINILDWKWHYKYIYIYIVFLLCGACLLVMYIYIYIRTLDDRLPQNVAGCHWFVTIKSCIPEEFIPLPTILISQQLATTHGRSTCCTQIKICSRTEDYQCALWIQKLPEQVNQTSNMLLFKILGNVFLCWHRESWHMHPHHILFLTPVCLNSFRKVSDGMVHPPFPRSKWS